MPVNIVRDLAPTGRARPAGWRLALAAGLIAMLPTAALAQDPIAQVLQGRGAEWADGFDAAAPGAAAVRTARPILSPETQAAMEYSIQRYSYMVSQGGWPVVPADKVLKIGMRDPSVMTLRQRLIVSGDLASSAGVSDVFDTYVDTAVKHFQARHGIPADGIVGATSFAALNISATARLGQLQVNLGRLRELTAQAPDRYVLVNIPAAQLEAVEAQQVVIRSDVVVGKVDRPSPILTSQIHQVNFNPFWTVPVSIIRRDLVPLMQRNPSYLTDQKIHIFDQRGQEILPTEINWGVDDPTRFSFRQEPGELNALGAVRINFHNTHGVYMHDTPNKALFGSEYRFDSSGCIRIANIRELIGWVLRDNQGYGRDQIDNLFGSGERLDVEVRTPVKLYWTYITAWAREDGVVQFRNDIYLEDNLDQLALR